MRNRVVAGGDRVRAVGGTGPQRKWGLRTARRFSFLVS